ncbi:hypothetical protein GCM10011609_13650 [Lentzea pudingi]|uniref:Uncharacterized protein n=1 Tax=Lentzea pudingi TaxID=1789439 RepID=A0ABQ2HFM6_9PSEU|nr:hypothetical protein GCM10011609_13650 [Lentzea pudingi]
MCRRQQGEGEPSQDIQGGSNVPSATNVSGHDTTLSGGDAGGVDVCKPGASPTQVAKEATTSTARNNPCLGLAAATVPIFSDPAGCRLCASQQFRR